MEAPTIMLSRLPYPINLFRRASLLVLLSLYLVNGALAAAWVPYGETAMKEAGNAGKTIVLHFEAKWCSTCRRQDPILKDLLEKKTFADFVAFKVDFDAASALRSEYSVTRQSTIIVMKGWKEVGRSIAEVEFTQIAQLLKKGL